MAGLLAPLLSNCQQGTYPVYFLTEADGMEAGSRFIILHNKVPYTRMPILSLDHFEKFRSFLNPDDGTYGVELTVKKEWRVRLHNITQECNGKLLLPVVNGFSFEPQFISPVTDGKLIIWNGLNGYDLRMISRTVEPINPEIEEKRYLDDNPRPAPKMPVNYEATKDINGRTFREIHS